MVQHRDMQGNDDDIERMLQGALGNADFDYDALISGTHQRAGRIRRRRAIATGVAVAVLGPALVGGGALIVPELLDTDSATVQPAGPTDGAVVTDEPTQETSDDASQTTEPVQEDPPWQDGEPPMPEGGAEPDNPDLPNAWEIPDARPAGVAILEELGAPQRLSNYPRTSAVPGLMACDPGNPDGVEPMAGQDAMFYSEAGSGPTIDIQVTGWEDSAAAWDGLLTDDYMSCTWDGAGEPQPWPGEESDEDRLIVPGTDGETMAAVVRQGDYLVSVTVREASPDEATEIATEIASKHADNLEALDPEHGRD